MRRTVGSDYHYDSEVIPDTRPSQRACVGELLMKIEEYLQQQQKIRIWPEVRALIGKYRVPTLNLYRLIYKEYLEKGGRLRFSRWLLKNYSELNNDTRAAICSEPEWCEIEILCDRRRMIHAGDSPHYKSCLILPKHGNIHRIDRIWNVLAVPSLFMVVIWDKKNHPGRYAFREFFMMVKVGGLPYVLSTPPYGNGPVTAIDNFVFSKVKELRMGFEAKLNDPVTIPKEAKCSYHFCCTTEISTKELLSATSQLLV